MCCNILNGSIVIFMKLRLVAFIDIYLQKTTNFVEKSSSSYTVLSNFCIHVRY